MSGSTWSTTSVVGEGTGLLEEELEVVVVGAHRARVAQVAEEGVLLAAGPARRRRLVQLVVGETGVKPAPFESEMNSEANDPPPWAHPVQPLPVFPPPDR